MVKAKCKSNPKIYIDPDDPIWKAAKEAAKRVAAWPEWKKKAAGVLEDKVPRDGCGAIFHVSELVYIQTHRYVGPYSCAGGDYWRQGEGQFVCPKCGYLNRLYERPKVEKLKFKFKSVNNVYED